VSDHSEILFHSNNAEKTSRTSHPQRCAISEQYLIPKSMSESGLMIKHEEVTAGEESEKDLAEVENGSPAALYKMC
jgi:hypothetical protein